METLRERVRTGGGLLCFQFPEGTDFGYDFKSWRVGPKFQGMKMIPKGLHLMSWGAGHDSTMAEFMWASPGEVQVRRWDPSLETFETAPVSGEELQRYTAAFHEFAFDEGTAGYAEEDHAVWEPLISLVDDDVLQRAGIPPGVHIMAGETTAESEPLAVVPHFDNVARTPTFSALPPRRPTDTAGWTAERISKYMYDGSDRLLILLEQYGWRAMLGELQLSFVLFLVVASLDAWNWWKQLVALVCSCSDALIPHADEIVGFLQVFREQLKHIPADFFIDELSRDNFLEESLNKLVDCIRMISDNEQGVSTAALNPAVQSLRDEATLLQALLRQRFQFELQLASDGMLEEGDDAPVVVDELCHLEIDKVPDTKEQSPNAVATHERMNWMLDPNESAGDGISASMHELD